MGRPPGTRNNKGSRKQGLSKDKEGRCVGGWDCQSVQNPNPGIFACRRSLNFTRILLNKGLAQRWEKNHSGNDIKAISTRKAK